MPDLRLMRCWVRSGGTLLNRCLGAHPLVVILSEVHPKGGGGTPDRPRTIHEQARLWYDIELQSTDFYDALQELSEVCDRQGKYLVMRGYTRRNYTEGPQHDSEFIEQLGKRFNLVPFAFIRDPIDILLSWSNEMLDELAMMRRYALDLRALGIPLFKYEKFCASPSAELARIFNYLKIPYADTTSAYQQFTSANGDFNYSAGASRGLRAGEIRVLPRRYLSPSRIRRLHASPDLKLVCETLGYNPDYYDTSFQRQSFSGFISEKLQRFARDPKTVARRRLALMARKLTGS